ncbi:MAG: hypothetical protein ACSLFB_09020 [Acidimicrobiales bacterium]
MGVDPLRAVAHLEEAPRRGPRLRRGSPTLEVEEAMTVAFDPETWAFLGRITSDNGRFPAWCATRLAPYRDLLDWLTAD